jgi:hypothetical protein
MASGDTATCQQISVLPQALWLPVGMILVAAGLVWRYPVRSPYSGK